MFTFFFNSYVKKITRRKVTRPTFFSTEKISKNHAKSRMSSFLRVEAMDWWEELPPETPGTPLKEIIGESMVSGGDVSRTSQSFKIHESPLEAH